MLTVQDFSTIAGIAALVFFQFGDGGSGGAAGASAPAQRQRYSPVPAWIFGPVWTTLYLTITANLSHYVLASDAAHEPSLTTAFAVLALTNLFLNKLWSVLFFGLRLVWISAVCALLIFATAVALAIVEAKDGEPWWSTVWLLGPYILWTLFATGLNIYVAATGYGQQRRK